MTAESCSRSGEGVVHDHDCMRDDCVCPESMLARTIKVISCLYLQYRLIFKNNRFYTGSRPNPCTLVSAREPLPFCICCCTSVVSINPPSLLLFGCSFSSTPKSLVRSHLRIIAR